MASKNKIANPYIIKQKVGISESTSTNQPTTNHTSSTVSQNNMSHMENDKHSANGTKGCRNEGIKEWERLVQMDSSLPAFHKISPRHDLNYLANRFIEYLLSAKSLRTKNLFAFGSLPTMFSGWKTALKYENNMKRMKEADFESQFRGLHDKLLSQACRRAIDNCEFVSKASENVRRELAASISKWILTNPRQAKDSLGWRDSAILATQRQAVGRGSEIQGFQWDGTFFNTSDNVLDANWIQTKTGKVSRMAFVDDKDWRLSMLVTWGGYIATKNGIVSEKKSWDHVFDDLPENVSAHVTNVILKRVEGKVPGVKKISSHCYRYGAIDDLNNNESLDYVCSLFRGGWDMEKFCTGFRYFKFKKEDVHASRVLAGYENPAVKVAAPSLSFIKDEELIKQLKEVADNLYGAIPNSEKPGDDLYTFKGVLLAATLENLEDMEVELTRENDYLRRISNAFKGQGLLWKQVLQIGKHLKQKRSEENEKIRLEMDLGYNVQKTMNILLHNQERLENELKESRAREAEQRSMITNLNAKMDLLLSTLLPRDPRVQNLYCTKRSADDIDYSSRKRGKTTNLTHEDVFESSSLSSLETPEKSPENVEASCKCFYFRHFLVFYLTH